jgi:hypothetical protein
MTLTKMLQGTKPSSPEESISPQIPGFVSGILQSAPAVPRDIALLNSAAADKNREEARVRVPRRQWTHAGPFFENSE